MHTTELMNRVIGANCQSIHKVRFESLMAAMGSALEGRCVSVTGLGRALYGTDEKPGIKRMDRLVGNAHLHAEIPVVYRALAHWLLRGLARPILLVDWSPLKEDNSLHALTASLPGLGRGIAVYQEVHPEAVVGKWEIHANFLGQLASVLPPECRPIVVTDAGFKNPWFRAVEKRGWDWVSRVRGTTQVTREGEDVWLRCTAIGRLLKSGQMTCCGEFLLARSNPLRCTIYGLHKPPKGRVDKTCRGQRAQSRKSRKNAAREREPWLLATSLPGQNSITAQVIEAYRKRMQIEEGFRDAKDERYGFGLDMALSHTKERYSVLLLIVALAAFASWLIGKVAHQQNLHRRYQANTITHRIVLSFVYLGRRIAIRGGIPIDANQLRTAKEHLRACCSLDIAPA